MLSAPITIHGVSSAAAMALARRLRRARHDGQRHAAADDTRGDDELPRVIAGAFMWLRVRRGAVNRAADAVVGAATADVRHRRVDLFIGGLRVFPQQRRGRHQHARLAVAALRHVDVQPGALQRMARIRGQTFDGRDLRADGGLSGTRQERVAAPSKCTVQAPHWPMPQPNFVPVIPR